MFPNTVQEIPNTVQEIRNIVQEIPNTVQEMGANPQTPYFKPFRRPALRIDRGVCRNGGAWPIVATLLNRWRKSVISQWAGS